MAPRAPSVRGEIAELRAFEKDGTVAEPEPSMAPAIDALACACFFGATAAPETVRETLCLTGNASEHAFTYVTADRPLLRLLLFYVARFFLGLQSRVGDKPLKLYADCVQNEPAALKMG